MPNEPNAPNAPNEPILPEEEIQAQARARANVMQVLRGAASHAMNLPDYPLDRSVIRRYPEVDMQGKASIMDVMAAQEIQKIKSAVKTKPPEVREVVNNLLQASKPLLRDVKKTSIMFRQTDIAGSLLQDPREIDILNAIRNNIGNRDEVKKLRLLTTACSYLTDRAPDKNMPKQLRDFCRNTLNCPIDDKVLQLAQQGPAAGISKLEIHMEPLNSLPNYLHNSDPRVFLNRNPQQVPINDAEIGAAINDILPTYVDRTLNQEWKSIYRGISRMNLVDNSRANNLEALPINDATVDHKDLTFINGVSLRSHLDKAIIENPELNLDERKMEQYTNNLLSQSLLEGKQVECYLPDHENKTIHQEPTRLTIEGVEPKEMSRPVMNGWQSYWSKRGYYKELAAKVKDFDTIQENRKNMKESMSTLREDLSAQWAQREERRLDTNLSAYYAGHTQDKTAIETQYFGQNYAQNREGVENSGYYYLQRSGANLAMCHLINDGHSIADVMDPSKLQAERAATGAQLREMQGRNNVVEFVSLVVPAMQKIMNEPNLPIDIGNLNACSKQGRAIAARAAIFDLYQETTRDPEMKQLIQENMGTKNYEKFNHDAGAYGSFYRTIEDTMLANSPNAVNALQIPYTPNDRLSTLASYQELMSNHSMAVNCGTAPGSFTSLDEIESAKGAISMASTMLEPEQVEPLLTDAVAGRKTVTLSPPTPDDPIPTATFKAPVEQPHLENQGRVM